MDPDSNGFSGDSSDATLKWSDQWSGRSESDWNDDGRRQRERRRKIKVIRPLNEMLARAADCRENKLVSKKGENQELSRHVTRFWKKIDFEMRP